MLPIDVHICVGRRTTSLDRFLPVIDKLSTIKGTATIYTGTWASLIAVYQYKALNRTPIETVVFPAIGAGFGGVLNTEVARQMAAAYRHYLRPPHRMDWDMVANRQRAIQYEGNRQVTPR